MTAKPSKTPTKGKSPDTLTMAVREGDDTALKMAEAMIAPYVTKAFAFSKSTRGTAGELQLDKLVTARMESAKRVREGNLKDVEGMLMTQATVLNGSLSPLRKQSIERGYCSSAAQTETMSLRFRYFMQTGSVFPFERHGGAPLSDHCPLLGASLAFLSVIYSLSESLHYLGPSDPR